jgi:hypothetical protein
MFVSTICHFDLQHSDSHGLLDVGSEELHIMDNSDDQPLATLARVLQQEKIMGSGLLEVSNTAYCRGHQQLVRSLLKHET